MNVHGDVCMGVWVCIIGFFFVFHIKTMYANKNNNKIKKKQTNKNKKIYIKNMMMDIESRSTLKQQKRVGLWLDYGCIFYC